MKNFLGDTDLSGLKEVALTVAASAALTISEIPFAGPVGAVRIGRIDGEFVVNPTYSQLADSELDLIVSGTREAIMMVEAGAKLLPESVMAEAILFGHRALQPLVDLQEELQKAVGKKKSVPYLEAGTGSVLDFAAKADAGDEFVIVDVETTGTDPKMADLVIETASRLLGEENVEADTRTLGGEDMSVFLEKVPGCFFFVGCGLEGPLRAHHSRNAWASATVARPEVRRSSHACASWRSSSSVVLWNR